MPSPAALLSEALSGHIELLKSLVDQSQREQQHLIAYEPRLLASLAEEKAATVMQVQRSEEGLRIALNALAEDVGHPADEEMTLTAVIGRTTGEAQAQLHEQAYLLRSLAESLRELQAVSLVHAERGLRVIRQYSSLLRHVDPEAEGEPVYTAQGRKLNKPLPPKTLSKTV